MSGNKYVQLERGPITLMNRILYSSMTAMFCTNALDIIDIRYKIDKIKSIYI